MNVKYFQQEKDINNKQIVGHLIWQKQIKIKLKKLEYDLGSKYHVSGKWVAIWPGFRIHQFTRQNVSLFYCTVLITCFPNSGTYHKKRCNRNLFPKGPDSRIKLDWSESLNLTSWSVQKQRWNENWKIWHALFKWQWHATRAVSDSRGGGDLYLIKGRFHKGEIIITWKKVVS